MNLTVEIPHPDQDIMLKVEVQFEPGAPMCMPDLNQPGAPADPDDIDILMCTDENGQYVFCEDFGEQWQNDLEVAANEAYYEYKTCMAEDRADAQIEERMLRERGYDV